MRLFGSSSTCSQTMVCGPDCLFVSLPPSLPSHLPLPPSVCPTFSPPPPSLSLSPLVSPVCHFLPIHFLPSWHCHVEKSLITKTFSCCAHSLNISLSLPVCLSPPLSPSYQKFCFLLTELVHTNPRPPPPLPPKTNKTNNNKTTTNKQTTTKQQTKTNNKKP